MKKQQHLNQQQQQQQKQNPQTTAASKQQHVLHCPIKGALTLHPRVCFGPVPEYCQSTNSKTSAVTVYSWHCT